MLPSKEFILSMSEGGTLVIGGEVYTLKGAGTDRAYFDRPKSQDETARAPCYESIHPRADETFGKRLGMFPGQAGMPHDILAEMVSTGSFTIG